MTRLAGGSGACPCCSRRFGGQNFVGDCLTGGDSARAWHPPGCPAAAPSALLGAISAPVPPLGGVGGRIGPQPAPERQRGQLEAFTRSNRPWVGWTWPEFS